MSSRLVGAWLLLICCHKSFFYVQNKYILVNFIFLLHLSRYRDIIIVKGGKDMSKKKGKKKKPTRDETSEKIAKYAMIGAWSYPAYELIKQIGRIVLTLVKHK